MNVHHEDNPILVTASYDQTIKFWTTNIPTWECSKSIELQKEHVVYRMKISNDKKYLVCAASKGVKLFDISDESNYQHKGDIDYGCNCTAVGFRGEGEWFFGSGEDGTLRVHDLRLTGSQIVYNNDVAINDVILSHSEGELIAGDESGRLIVYDLVASKVRLTTSPNPSAEIGIRSVCMSANNTAVKEKYLCAADSSGAVYVWKVANDQDLNFFTKIQAHNDYILKCAISANNERFVTCSADKSIKVFSIDPQEGFRQGKSLLGHTRWVWDCEFIHGSKQLISVSTDNCLKVWDLASGNQLKHSMQHKQGVLCCALHDRPIDE